MLIIVALEISSNVLFTMDTDTEERILLYYGLYKILSIAGFILKGS